MRTYSMDLRERALLDSDAGMKAADVAAKYRVSRPPLGRRRHMDLPDQRKPPPSVVLSFDVATLYALCPLTQGVQRVDASGSPRREPACEQRHSDEQGRPGHESQRIQRRHAEQHALDKTRRRGGAQQAHDDPGGDKRTALPND